MELSPADMLAWYLDAGVDECIGETAMDRFAQSATQAQARATALAAARSAAAPTTSTRPRPSAPTGMDTNSVPMLETEAPPPSLGEIRAKAEALAAAAMDLDQLHQTLTGFTDFPLRQTALNTVFAAGDVNASLMIIGECPDAEEDRQGVPFVGPAGKLLDAMLAAIGLSRQQVYLTNLVPWRSVLTPKPTSEEQAICLPFLRRHIQLKAPKVILMLGGSTASNLLNSRQVFSRLRGQWHDVEIIGQPPIKGLVSYHPAYLLATPHAKRESWADLQKIAEILERP